VIARGTQIRPLAALCRDGKGSYARIRADEL